MTIWLRWLGFLAAALALAGCFSQNNSSRRQVRQAQAECQKLQGDPQLDPLRGKLALRMDQITPSMLIIPSAPNGEEKVALAAFAKIRQECNKGYLSAAADLDTDSAYQLQATLSRYDLVYGKLGESQISFGNANQLLEQTAIEATGDYDQTILEGLRSADAQRRQAARDAGANLIRPTYANCVWADVTLNCTQQ
jgi:hypothetical protein